MADITAAQKKIEKQEQQQRLKLKQHQLVNPFGGGGPGDATDCSIDGPSLRLGADNSMKVSQTSSTTMHTTTTTHSTTTLTPLANFSTLELMPPPPLLSLSLSQQPTN
jgi:hypothetical protein